MIEAKLERDHHVLWRRHLAAGGKPGCVRPVREVTSAHARVGDKARTRRSYFAFPAGTSVLLLGPFMLCL